jgi:type I restriction enzyme R subunit
MGLVADHADFFKQFVDNSEFGKWLADTVFQATYKRPPGPEMGGRV